MKWRHKTSVDGGYCLQHIQQPRSTQSFRKSWIIQDPIFTRIGIIKNGQNGIFHSFKLVKIKIWTFKFGQTLRMFRKNCLAFGHCTLYNINYLSYFGRSANGLMKWVDITLKNSQQWSCSGKDFLKVTFSQKINSM